jgi:hypothetical protein
MAEALLAVLTVVFSVEYFMAIRRGDLTAGTLLDWNVYSLQPGWVYKGWRSKLLVATYRPRTFRLITLARGFIATSLLWLDPASRGVVLALLLALALLVNLRHAHGRDGGDEMGIIVLAGLAVYRLAGPESAWRWAGVIFISAQATLAYMVSGVAKLVSMDWRSGKALPAILATEIYGQPRLLRYMHWSGIFFVGSWSILLWETSFIGYWATPMPWAMAWLAAGLAFHIATAVVMGLNTFLLAFIAAYPILVLCHELLHSQL